MSRLIRIAGLIGLFTVLVPGVFARQPGDSFRPGFNLFSKEQDIQLGQETSAEVMKKAQVVNNKSLQDYVSKVGQRLASAKEAKESGFPFRFALIVDPSINAFALPGGPMFINSGLLKAVDNEAQLAGVMAHEMSHVILRHGTNQASKQNLIVLPAMLAGAMAGGSMLGQLTQLGIGLGANSVLLKFSRTAESQADLLGSHLMSEEGYNPIEMARFFEKLEAEGGARGPQFFSDHPNPGNRQKAIEEEIQGLPQRSYGYETGEFAKARQQVAQVPDKVKPGPGAAQNGGAAPGGGNQTPGLPPSNKYTEYRGQSFALSYPDNWQAFPSNDTQGVTIAPAEGIVQAQQGGAQIGVGVIAGYLAPQNESASLSDRTDQLISQLKQENPNLRSTGSRRKARVDSRDGLVTMLKNNSPLGGVETDALLTVDGPRGLLYIVFVAPENKYSDLQKTFEQVMGSIKLGR